MLQVIDTATPQRNLDFTIPFGAGFRDCYVKMGGDNVDTYVAPYYVAEVDRAIAAGFAHVGHYWVPDANPNDPDTIDTPTQQADWMVDRMHRWDPTTGFVVLDNENLDGAIRFGDSQAAEFIERVKARLGIPGAQILFYTNLSDARANEWPRVLATGANFLIAAPSYPPGELPVISTIPADRIVGHQYGTRSFGGVVTDVNVFWDHAFDYGGIMSLENKAREFAAKYPTPASSPSTSTDTTYDQNCGIAMYQFAAFLGWRTGPDENVVYSAYAVAMNSGRLNTDAQAAPVGAWHFWDIGGPGNGHVAQEMDGNNLVFMGSAKVWEDLGVDIGFSSVSEYSRLTPLAKYLGWATNYAGGTISTTTTAGLGQTPVTNRKDPDMPIRVTGTNRGIGLIAGGEFATLKNSEEVAVAGLVAAKDIKISDRQWDVMKSIFNRDQAGAPVREDRTDEILAAIAAVDAGTGSSLSAAEYANAVVDELNRRTAS